MLNIADFLIAGFIFLLFVSIYRKRSSVAVRFWVVGWFCMVLHFGVLVFPPHTQTEQVVQRIAALGTLVLCGTAFALSRPGSHVSERRQLWIGGLLGIPWLLVMIFGSLSIEWLWATILIAVLSEMCVMAVALQLFGVRHPRSAATGFVVVGTGVWLASTCQAHDLGGVQRAVLTLCFGFNAVLLSVRRPRFSAAAVTTSVGTIAWAQVWIWSAMLDRFVPGLQVSPEIWNLPKYLVAAGMVLSLLDEEIRKTELASEQYRLLFAGNPHPMWIYDPETLRFLEVNDAAVVHYGFSHAEFQDRTLLDVVEVNGDEETVEALRTTEAQTLSGPWLHRRKNGNEFQVEIASHPVVREGQRATFALIHDVTEPQRLHAQLIRQAHHDVLTGLPNRALFEHSVEAALEEAAAERCKAAVFCIDLDRFKQINDTFGHDAGDRCLCAMAARITRRLEGRGVLARTGGDEFMLVVGGLSETIKAEMLASELIADMKPSVTLDCGEVELIASIGIAVYPEDGQTVVQLWRDADAAMYQAKRAGGAQWVRVSREISSTASEANEIELGLRRALKSGDLRLCYQPQLTAAGELHSLEALVRFPDPCLSSAPADRVISIAEESGLIAPLGLWVLEEVCRQSREWMDDGLRPVQVALNVSPIQLNRSDFSLAVASTLERYALSPRLLEFEVTESTVMPDKGQARDQIAVLARMGIRFAVDDFGTGYSSLGRLHQLPVESLKIDCSFTRRIAERKGTFATVQAIVALAHTFGLKVVAEGVETEEQLRVLRSLGCDRVQGYLFSRPLPAEEIRNYLLAAEPGRMEAEMDGERHGEYLIHTVANERGYLHGSKPQDKPGAYGMAEAMASPFVTESENP